MSGRAVALLVLFVAIGVGTAAYVVGVAHGRGGTAATAPVPSAQPVQALVPQPQVPFSAPQNPGTGPGPTTPLQEFIPLPGPGNQAPGQRPQPQSGECEPVILFYHNGQLYQLRPGQGPQDGQGRPGTPPEFYQLNPYQGPAIPGLPAPRPDRGPGFAPVNPRS